MATAPASAPRNAIAFRMKVILEKERRAGTKPVINRVGGRQRNPKLGRRLTNAIVTDWRREVKKKSPNGKSQARVPWPGPCCKGVTRRRDFCAEPALASGS